MFMRVSVCAELVEQNAKMRANKFEWKFLRQKKLHLHFAEWGKDE